MVAANLPYLIAAPVGVGAIVLQRTFRRKKGKGDDEKGRRDGDGDVTAFACERVCTSDRLIKRLGYLAKDPTPNTCVTVCGSSGIDACTEACQRSVCSAPHSVPSWNDQCNKRCTQECLRGRT
mmetsp:Transcript_11646/g.41930  ORF Transcript_11646/g.41930 Transcript_11646/m.41930 type:complete len:123 (+) Transcript_11646:83-451(+)